MLLTFKCLYGLAPQYLADLIAVAPQSRYNLRSRNATLLVSAKARCLPTLGNRAFQLTAPKLWNSLPVEIRNIRTLTSFKQALKTYFFNPLTPVPPITARDEPWPFFLFWHHHFWPKLASSILNFCRRKRSFQWCPDQSDRPNGALDMHKNAQKVEWKTRSKISCHYTWMLHAKNYPSRLMLCQKFFNRKQAQ